MYQRFIDWWTKPREIKLSAEEELSIEVNVYFSQACLAGRLGEAKKQYERYKKVTRDTKMMHDVFIECCRKGNLDVIKWMWEIWDIAGENRSYSSERHWRLMRLNVFRRLESMLQLDRHAVPAYVVKWLCTIHKYWEYDELRCRLAISDLNNMYPRYLYISYGFV
jgi:hypothetical protein